MPPADPEYVAPIEGYLEAPVDADAARTLAGQGLRLALVDLDDVAAARRWFVVESRGFHDPMPTDDAVDRMRRGLAYRRTSEVTDGDDPEPVGTVESWPAPLTVPGGRTVPGWAISGVTVAPTHRRRGVARAMLTAELRTAASLGVPIAMLTVSEATIYGRFGFAPAASAARYTIDPRRARWSGPTAAGRVRFVDADGFRRAASALADRSRLDSPGEIPPWPSLWERMLHADDPAEARKLRLVRYDDEHGVARGAAVYTVTGNDHAHNTHTLTVEYLVTTTDDAYAGLWRFLLEHDLLSEVAAPLRSIAEPLLWQVSDQRAVVRSDVRDHQWLRLIDVPAALASRDYSAADRVLLEVHDPLGLADGSVLLETSPDGSGRAEAAQAAPDDAAHLALGVDALSALYLGAVSAVTLVRAGRVEERRAGSAARFDAVFRSSATPWLSIWY